MLEKNGDKTTYSYDSNDRLISVFYPSDKFFNYTYDSSGNRISERMETGSTWNHTNYYYDKDDRLVKTGLWVKGVKGIVKQVDYSYDSNGNLIKKIEYPDIPNKTKTTTYAYDFENRLMKVITPAANLSFNYCSCPTLTGIGGYGAGGECGACGPSGKRISKTVDDKTIYTLCFDPTMDLDVNGNIIARYVQNPNVLDEPISIETAQGKFYYLFDGLGSVTGLTDNGGNLVATYKYDAFGNIVSETGDATLNAINPYRYTSRVWDKEFGLYYYRARYYDANTGRFTQKDPLRSELREGNNLYVYVGNNPVNRVDPSGLLWCCKQWGTRCGWPPIYCKKSGNYGFDTDYWRTCTGFVSITTGAGLLCLTGALICIYFIVLGAIGLASFLAGIAYACGSYALVAFYCGIAALQCK